MVTRKVSSTVALRRNIPAYIEAKRAQVHSDSKIIIASGKIARALVENPKQFSVYIKSPEANLSYLSNMRHVFKSAYRLLRVQKAMKGDSAKIAEDMEKLRTVISMINDEMKQKKAIK